MYLSSRTIFPFISLQYLYLMVLRGTSLTTIIMCANASWYVFPLLYFLSTSMSLYSSRSNR